MTRSALIVDDNRCLAEDLGEILESEGYKVWVYHDPERALSDATDLDFDVALLDIRMARIDGVTLHRLLSQHHPRARFVLMTAYTEDDRIEQALSAGVKAVLTKPVPLRDLFDALGNGESRTLLLVEGDQSLRAALDRSLSESGYTCVCVASAREARALLATEAAPIAAVIVDAALPDADGASLAAELAAQGSVPAVLIADRGSQPALALEAAPGCRSRVVQKPLTPEALLRALSELRAGPT